MSGFESFNTHDTRCGNGYWLTRRDGVWSAKKSRGQYAPGGPIEVPMDDPALREDMEDRLAYYQRRVELLTEALAQGGSEAPALLRGAP